MHSATVVSLASLARAPISGAANDITRRRLLGSFLATAALLGLGACGDDSNGDGAPSSPSSPATRTIDTAFGPVTTPANPKNVVCVDTYSISALLDVGFTPVGVADGASDLMLPKYRDTYNSMKKVAAESGEVDLEAVAALKPDLIIGLDMSPITEVRDKLSGIAPTCLFVWQTPGDWEKLVASATTAVGRGGQETSLEQDYHERAKGISTQYASVLATTKWDMISGGGDSGWVWLPNSDVGIVLVDAGVQLAGASAGTAVGSNDGGSVQVSYEQLVSLADADVIAVRAGEDGKPETDTAMMMSEPTFATLPAMRAGHVFAFQSFFPFSYGQALALLDELEGVLKQLA